MRDIEKIREFFSGDKYAMSTTGIEIEAVGENYAKCSIMLDDRHKNALGKVMGAVMYTLADFVFAVSTNEPDGKVTVTVVSQITYLGVCKGNKLIGESKLLKDGKRNCFMQVDIYDELGNPVAVVNTNGVHLG